MPRNIKKNKPLTISSSYESYCRERKAARSRSIIQAPSGHDIDDDRQQPLIEIQSRDDDDEQLGALDDKKNKWSRRLMTPDTVPTTASWSVSSKTIVNSWYQPASVGTTETAKTISSYACNNGVFSPLYEVTSEHVNVYEQSGLPLPKPGQTPRFGKLTYKREKNVSNATDEKGDRADQKPQREIPTISSRQVREQWQQLQDKTDKLLGPRTPAMAAAASSVSCRRAARKGPAGHREEGLAYTTSATPSLPTSPVRTFESYMKGEWRLGSSDGRPSNSIESDLSLDPIVQVQDSKEVSSARNHQQTESSRPCRAEAVGDASHGTVGRYCCMGADVSSLRYEDHHENAGGRSGASELPNVVIDDGRCSIGADSRVEMELSQTERYHQVSRRPHRQDTESIQHHEGRQGPPQPNDGSKMKVADVTLSSDGAMGSAKLPLHLESHDYSKNYNNDDELSQCTKDALIPPNLFERTQSIFGSSSWQSPSKKEESSETASNVLIDVTSISHNQSEDNVQTNNAISLRPTSQTTNLNNNIDHGRNTSDHQLQLQPMDRHAPSAEELYQSMMERNIKQQRGLTPKASKAITIHMDDEDLKPVVYLSRQFTHHSNESVYQSGVALISSPTTSDVLQKHVHPLKQQPESFDDDRVDRRVRSRRLNENRCEVQIGGDQIITDLTNATTPGGSEHYPLQIGSNDLDLPDLNDICLRTTGSDFESVDIYDDELRAVMQITNDGENASVIFPTFSCETIPECFSDDGLSFEVSALAHMQEELEVCMQAANSVSPKSMQRRLTSPIVYGSSGDSSMADLRGVCCSSSDKSRTVPKTPRDSLPFAKKVQFKDDIQELLYVHEIASFEDPPTPPKRSFLDRVFSSLDDLIDDMGSACISCSGTGRPRKSRGRRGSSRPKYAARMEV